MRRCTTCKFNTVTLQPNDSKERKLFWTYRCEDISEQFTVRCLIVALSWLILLLSHFYSKTDVSLIKLEYRSINVALCIAVWLLGKRIRKQLVWVIVALYLAELVLITQESIHEHARSDGDGPLMSNDYFMRMMFDYLFYVSFLTPSYHLIVLCYIPGIILAMGINIY